MARIKTTKASQARKAIESKPSDPASLSGTLRAAMIAHKTGTAYVVAKDAGVSVDAVQRFLSGERDLRLETADKIAAALGLRLAKVEPSE